MTLIVLILLSLAVGLLTYIAVSVRTIIFSLVCFIDMTQRAGKEMRAMSKQMKSKYFADDLGKRNEQAETIRLTGPRGQA